MVHFSHYIIHHTLYTTLCTLHSALCTLHSALCTLHSALCTLHSALCTPHAPRPTPHTTHYSLLTTHHTPHTAHHTPHTTHYTLHHTPHTTHHTTHNTPHTTHRTPHTHVMSHVSQPAHTHARCLFAQQSAHSLAAPLLVWYFRTALGFTSEYLWDDVASSDVPVAELTTLRCTRLEAKEPICRSTALCSGNLFKEGGWTHAGLCAMRGHFAGHTVAARNSSHEARRRSPC